jgi:hypothetical protein
VRGRLASAQSHGQNCRARGRIVKRPSCAHREETEVFSAINIVLTLETDLGRSRRVLTAPERFDNRLTPGKSFPPGRPAGQSASFCCVMAHDRNVKRKDLTPKQVLAVRCPTCGASPRRRCELGAGGLRTTPHRDRALCAADAAEAKGSRSAYAVLSNSPPTARHWNALKLSR